MKPLYITHCANTQVITQGTALRIKSDQLADAVIATRFISEIICACKVQWRSDALHLCMQQGIPIVFTGSNGDVAGFLHGIASQRQASLMQRLCNALEHPYGHRLYQTWLRSMHSRRRVKLSKALGIAGDYYRISKMRELIHTHRRSLASDWVIQWLESTWNQAIAGLIMRELKQHGLTAARQELIWRDLDIVNDLRELMVWEMYLPACELLPGLQQQWQQHSSSRELKHQLLSAFARQTFAMQVILQDALHRLDQCLRSMHEV